MSNKIAHIESLAKRMEERVAAMQLLYSEMLEKIREIDRLL